jgi:hypothetical protein
MNSPHLIPPSLPRPTFRQTLLAALYGAVGGGVLGSVVWLATGDVYWFYAIPICAILGAWARRERPNVLWGRRAH